MSFWVGVRWLLLLGVIGESAWGFLLAKPLDQTSVPTFENNVQRTTGG
jgi:hypothetical protein